MQDPEGQPTRRLHGQGEPLLAPDASAAIEAFDAIGTLDAPAALAAINALIDERGFSPAAEAFAANNDFAAPTFGRLFPGLPPFQPPSELLIELGAAMADPDTRVNIPQLPEPTADDSTIPSGFTYFSQFVDHDITLDPTIGFPPSVDPDNLISGRTPTLDLDSVYGLGPEENPQFYDPDFPASEARFKQGTTTPVPDVTPGSPLLPSFPNDLPRIGGQSADRRQAVIPDLRNDENLVIAQLSLAFMKFHNKLMDEQPECAEGETLFETVRRLVRWHYQWIVLNDFLPRVVDPAVLADVCGNGRRFYTFEEDPGTPFMPVEFSVAAYRMGHSMVRNSYSFNRIFTLQLPGGPVTRGVATLDQLFLFTGARGLGGLVDTLPSNWIIDWRRFFQLGGPPVFPIPARKIDSRLAFSLRNVPDVSPQEPVSLASRNLLRGRLIGLPTGQCVTTAMKEMPLTPAQIAGGPEGDIVVAHGFDLQTPLWFYLLREAIVQGQGNRLGAIGSRIVAEVFVGILQGDPRSFLVMQPDWTPTVPAATPGTFTMADLLRYVNDINPLG
ncbi:MAG: peroxidase family protein [Egibacteraceae bacterium]